jgi:hypothetical protein
MPGPIGREPTAGAQPNGLPRGSMSARGALGRADSAPSFGGSAHQWYTRYQEADKWRERYKSLKELADEDTRSGEILKISVDVLQKGLAAILEVEESTIAPFFKYYAVHVQLLGELLDTDGKTERAKEKLEKAADICIEIRQQADACVRKFAISADPTLKQLDGWVAWWLVYRRAVQSPNARVTSDEAASVRATLQLMEQLLVQAEGKMVEILSTSHRIEIEFEALQEAFNQYKAKKEKMEQGNAFDRISARKNLEEAEGYASLDNRQELHDPVGYAQGSVRQIDRLAENWAIALDSLANGERLRQNTVDQR